MLSKSILGIKKKNNQRKVQTTSDLQAAGYHNIKGYQVVL